MLSNSQHLHLKQIPKFVSCFFVSFLCSWPKRKTSFRWKKRQGIKFSLVVYSDFNHVFSITDKRNTSNHILQYVGNILWWTLWESIFFKAISDRLFVFSQHLKMCTYCFWNGDIRGKPNRNCQMNSERFAISIISISIRMPKKSLKIDLNLTNVKH